MSKSTAIYMRVSSIGQKTDSQEAEIDRWLLTMGIQRDSCQWFTDKATGTNLERPAFRELDAAIERGKVDQVIIWRLDRLSRSIADGISTIVRWLERGVRLRCVAQPFDFSGSIGQMVASLLLGIAQIENESRRERQAAGIAAAKAKGKTWGGRKPGIASKEKARKCVELRAKGMSVRDVAKYLNLSTATVQKYCKVIQNS